MRKEPELFIVSDPHIGTLMWEPPDDLMDYCSKEHKDLLHDFAVVTLPCFMHLLVALVCLPVLIVFFGPRLQEQLLRLSNDLTTFLNSNYKV